METRNKKSFFITTLILYFLSALFVLFGIYMLYASILYVQNYNSYGTVSASNILQYILSSCSSYFGFGIIIFAAARILGKIKILEAPVQNDDSLDNEMPLTEEDDPNKQGVPVQNGEHKEELSNENSAPSEKDADEKDANL